MSKLYFLKCFAIFISGFFVSSTTPAQLIFTKAGSNNPGDYGAATNASLKNPYSSAIDGSGNVYIADYGNHRIRKITAGSGIITTVAGTGISGSTGDGNLATLARLNSPTGIAVDGSGNLFIADYNNHRIRKVTAATGIISTIAGTGTGGFSGDGSAATAANLFYPFSMAFDGDGNMFIADLNNQRIRKITAATGFISTIAGTGIAGFSGDGGAASLAQLNNPSYIVVDVSGNIIIADRSNHRIRKIAAATGLISTIAGTGISGFSGDGSDATAAQLNTPYGVAVDGSGNIFITDRANQRLRKITAATGFISTIAGTGNLGFSGDGSAATGAQLNIPYGVALDANGDLFISEYGNQRVRKIVAATGIISTVSGTGGSDFSGDGGDATLAQLNGPFCAVADGSGNTFIADYTNYRIRKITAATGIISTIAGTGISGFSGDGGAASAAQIASSPSVAVDGAGNVFFADRGNARLRKIAAGTGYISTIAGTGTTGFSGDGGAATAAKINTPWGIVVDGAGNVFFSETTSPRIRKITAATGIISTIAGTGTSGFSGDGGAATSAQIGTPYGLAVDGAGNVFIADGGNHRIRKVTVATGIISTVAGTGTNGFSGDGGMAVAALLNIPISVALDGNGNMFIADFNNNRIRKVTAGSGIISTVAGTGGTGFFGDGGAAAVAQVASPRSVAVDGSGNLLIADPNNNRIRYVCTNSTLPQVTATGRQTVFNAANNTVVFMKGCEILNKILPAGVNPVGGSVSDSVWVETAVPSSAGQPYVQRHYGITPLLNGGSATATITLYYTQGEFTAFNAAAGHGLDLPTDAADAANNKANLRIMQRKGTSKNGSGLFDTYSGAATTITPAAVTWSTALSRWEVTFDVTGFSGFFATSGTMSVLPMKLTDFRGRLYNGEGQLNWKTANEENTSRFDLERSTDGSKFSKLAEIPASGSSSSLKLYNYTDKTITGEKTPVVYYRLKMLDRDEKFTYSDVIAINLIKQEAVVTLYPNPVHQTATLQVSASRNENITMNIIAQNGQVVCTKKVDINGQTNNISIDVASLPPGIYTLVIKGSYTDKKLKLVKQ